MYMFTEFTGGYSDNTWAFINFRFSLGRIHLRGHVHLLWEILGMGISIMNRCMFNISSRRGRLNEGPLNIFPQGILIDHY